MAVEDTDTDADTVAALSSVATLTNAGFGPAAAGGVYAVHE
jgi:hypothetical protein